MGHYVDIIISIVGNDCWLVLDVHLDTNKLFVTGLALRVALPMLILFRVICISHMIRTGYGPKECGV